MLKNDLKSDDQNLSELRPLPVCEIIHRTYNAGSDLSAFLPLCDHLYRFEYVQSQRLFVESSPTSRYVCLPSGFYCDLALLPNHAVCPAGGGLTPGGLCSALVTNRPSSPPTPTDDRRSQLRPATPEARNRTGRRPVVSRRRLAPGRC